MWWSFDRADRLTDLIARARLASDYLRRAACDVRGADRAAYHARAAVVEARTRRLCDEARRARRTALATA